MFYAIMSRRLKIKLVLSCPIWCLGLCVVLDCINSWSVPSLRLVRMIKDKLRASNCRCIAWYGRYAVNMSISLVGTTGSPSLQYYLNHPDLVLVMLASYRTARTAKVQKVSEYDQEIPQLHTADQHTAPCKRDTKH